MDAKPRRWADLVGQRFFWQPFNTETPFAPWTGDYGYDFKQSLADVLSGTVGNPPDMTKLGQVLWEKRDIIYPHQQQLVWPDIGRELQRLPGAPASGIPGNGAGPVKDHKPDVPSFSFDNGQVLYHDPARGDIGLDLPAGFTCEVLGKLWKRKGKAVEYPALDEHSIAKEASPALRKAKMAISGALHKRRIPWKIRGIRRQAYILETVPRQGTIKEQ